MSVTEGLANEHAHVAKHGDQAYVLQIDDKMILSEEQVQGIGRVMMALIDHIKSHTGRTGPKPKLIIDFSKVTYTTSALIAKMITFDKKAKQLGISPVTLTALVPEIYEVFAITRLNKLFDIKEKIEDALASSGPGQAAS